MPNEMGRYSEVIEFDFAASGTVSNTVNIQRFAGFLLLIPAEFNTDTLTIGTGEADDPGFTITAATGRYRFSSDEMLGLFPMHKMRITTNVATAAAAKIRMLCKT